MVVAEVERADGAVRVMQLGMSAVRQQYQLAIREAVVAVHRRRDWMRKVELGRVADERGSHVDAAVEERRVVDGGDGQNDVSVGQVLTTLPLNDALVRAAHVHHLSCETNAIVAIAYIPALHVLLPLNTILHTHVIFQIY